jgi:hypothetical protein
MLFKKMTDSEINWTEVYQSLHIDSLKTTGKWMLIATLIFGFVLIAAAFLIFRKHLVVGLAMTVGVIIFSGRYALGLLRLSKNPVVYSGIVIRKFETSRTNDGTYSETIHHYIKMKVSEACEIDGSGQGAKKELRRQERKWRCPEQIYNQVSDGDSLMVLVMPHDNHIARIFKN